MNTLFVISRLNQDPQDFNTKNRKRAVKLSLRLDSGVIEALVFGEQESGALKLLYEKGDYVMIEGSLAEFENKIIVLIKDYFFFLLSQRGAKSITKGYRK